MPKFKTKRLKAVGVKTVVSWRPCPEYTEERIRALFAGRRWIWPANTFGTPILDEDKIWALCQDWVPDESRHRFALWCAGRALRRERKAGREPDPRSWEALRVKSRWLQGKPTDEELRAAESAARDAVPAATAARSAVPAATAARDAAWYAAWYAAEDAAWYAAWYAARSAADAAAWSAAWSAAWGAEFKAQCRWWRRELRRLAA